MRFIDFHAHVLPGLDDGSPDVGTSLEMLRKWSSLGVEKIVATPHFDFRDISTEKFLKNREDAYKNLTEAISASGEHFCEIALGAEIMYSSNIFGFVDLSSLSLAETPFVIVELSSELSSEKVSRIVSGLSYSDVILILAHTERYKDFSFLRKLKKLREAGVRFQVNFSSFLPSSHFFKTADAMMRADMVDLLATDAHNMQTRTPDFSESLRCMYKEYGKQKIDRILERSVGYFG